MKRIAALALCAGLLSLTAAAWAQGDAIAERKNGMKLMGGVTEAVKAAVDAGGPVTPLVPRIEQLLGEMRAIPSQFPPGSGTGDTRARDVIWSDHAGFLRAAENGAKAAEALLAAAQSGDVAATRTALGQVGGTCGACHRAYRGR
ncbi:cytochrome c [Acetobacteraceae bacterium H6797]|nr:cytochrome c [Acetobacteraceae bacterium H6797]